MISRVRSYFKEAKLARMSDGTLCLVRDLGLVKGGKGMKHHETLVTLSVRGLISGLRPSRLSATWSALEPELRANSSRGL
jgi:hypothetical protein